MGPVSRSLALALIAVAVILTVAAATGAAAGFDLALLEIIRDPGLREPLGALGTVTAFVSTEAIAVIAGVTVLIGLATGRARLGALGATSMVLAIIGTPSKERRRSRAPRAPGRGRRRKRLTESACRYPRRT